MRTVQVRDRADTELKSAWARFREESAACDEALLAALRTVSDQLNDMARERQEALLSQSLSLLRPPGLDAFGDAFRSEADRLLLKPLEAYRAWNPHHRVMRAFADHDARMEAAIASVPEFVTANGREWFAAIGGVGMSRIDRFRTASHWRRRRIPLRQNLLAGFYFRRRQRRGEQGEMLRLVSEAGLNIIAFWQVFVETQFSQLSAQPSQSVLADEIVRIQNLLDEIAAAMAKAVTAIVASLSQGPDALANRFPHRTSPALTSLVKLQDQYFVCSRFWTRQRRAVDSAMDMEVGLFQTEVALALSAGEFIDSAAEEFRLVAGELDTAIEWLGSKDRSIEDPFPPAAAEIIPAAQRVRTWWSGVKTALLLAPERLELVLRLRALPKKPAPWRTSRPRQTLDRWLHRIVARAIEPLSRDVERQNRDLIVEIERAREIVSFAMETARTGSHAEKQIEHEGITNARGLLEFQRGLIHDLSSQMERAMTSALASAFRQTHEALEGEHVRIWTRAARYGLPAAVRTLALSARQNGQEGIRKLSGGIAVAYREAMIRIGWASTPTARLQHVVVREHVGPVFRKDTLPESVPMLYRRLFRLQPVEDPRFLVGRGQELAALAEARQLWDAGRAASVLVVGERGSGKTSLINCAMVGVLAGVPVVRGQFGARLTQVSELRAFLAHLIGAAGPDQLEAALNAERRVVIIEEIERCFLRRTRHFDAIRALMRLISISSRTTLWITATNYASFRFLNAAINLDTHFSHRINAMAVEPEHLKEAILMRHSLSGLRLHVEDDLARPSWRERLARLAESSGREQRCHEAIYAASAGVFRSAFALWQRQIDRVDDGVLYMRVPEARGNELFPANLPMSDLFLIVAVLQHGSLTVEDAAATINSSVDDVRAQVDDLLARGILEPDPGHPGFRIALEAAAIVQEALYRRNLA